MSRLLDEHVRVLVTDHLRRTVGPEGPVYGQEPALLALLRGAVGNGSESGRGGAAGNRAGAPVDLTALSLWHGIETSVDAWWRVYCRTEGAVRVPIGNKLRAVAANVTEVSEVVRVTEQCEAWIERIRGVLEPQVKLTLDGACPECTHTHITVDSDEGQVVYRAALVAYPDHALCQACDAEWWGADMHTLAYRIRAADDLVATG